MSGWLDLLLEFLPDLPNRRRDQEPKRTTAGFWLVLLAVVLLLVGFVWWRNL